MGKLSKRMRRLLAVLLVEVIVASNVFISYADENDDGIMYQISEEEIAEEVDEEQTENFSDDDSEEEYDEMNSSDESEDTPDDSEEEEEISEENSESEDPDLMEDQDPVEEPGEEDHSEAVECVCDTACTADGYNANCQVCIGAADADDMDAFLADYCDGEQEREEEEGPEETDEEDKTEPETVMVDNSVTVAAVCVADGEMIVEAESFEIVVDRMVDLLKMAPEIEGYTFAGKVTIKDNGSAISQMKKETVEEKEETEIDGEKVVTKITTTTFMSFYDGTQWRELEDDITVMFEYTRDEESGKEETEIQFVASFVDQDGNAIDGYTNKTLTFDDTLDLTKEPVAIDNYEYVEAQINDTVVTAVHKKIETDEEGKEAVIYSYTADGEETEVTEDTEVTFVYEGGEEVAAAEITFVCIDGEGLTIAGYEKAELPEFADELILDNMEKAPIEIEGYEYKEAMIDGTAITSLIKEAEKVDAESQEGVSVYSYVTREGETVVIEEDTEIILSYEEAEVAVALDATIVDEFGDEIAEKYTNMDISKIFDQKDEMTLDDPEMPPVKKVSVRQSLFKTIKYTYVKASVDQEIIKGLKRKALEGEDAKASGKEYVYSYTTDGETWKKIKEDTTVIFEYSDGKKTTYTYEDHFVSVTATLQHANAIPDDAKFVVTPVTSRTSGYNYDVYMETLNANADQIGDFDKEFSNKNARKYTEENTLLYDIAFLADPVDEEGNAIEGGKVEYQPAEGMVKISFAFKQKQLEEDLNAQKAGDVTVVHMPLADDVKESAGTTANATGISTDDVTLEVVSASASVTAEVVDFSLSNFSISAFVAEGVKSMKPGTPASIESVLGEAVNYGVVANEMTLAGHMETNFATGSLHGNANVQSCKNNGGGAGYTYIGAYDGSDFTMDLNGNAGMLMIYTTEEAMRNFGFNMTHLHSGDPLDNLQFRNGVMIDYITYTESAIKDKVSGMINSVASASAKLMANGEKEGYDYHEIKDQYSSVIDIAAMGSEDTGTYYINFKEGEFPVSGYTIKIKSGQNVVLNIPDTKVEFGQFKLEVDGKQYVTQGGSDEEIVIEKVIFNCPNATKASTVGATDGTFLLPNAVFSNDSVAAGFLVANTISKIGGQEWHAISKGIPIVNPASFELRAVKTVNGQAPVAEENGKFTFVLSSVDENGQEVVIEQVVNHEGTVQFTKFDNIRQPGTYWYKIQEIGVAEGLEGYSIDKVLYYAKVEVSAVTEGLITNTNAKVTYYKDSKDGEVIGVPAFDNRKEEKGSVVVSKVVTGKITHESFYFVLTDSNGNPVLNEDGSTAVYEVAAGSSVRVDGLAYDTYTLTETDAKGNAVSFESGFPYKVTYSSQSITINSKEVQIASIINTFDTTNVSGSKTWDDGENQDGKRPVSITINLHANGEKVFSKVVTEADGWKWNFKDLPKYAEGTEIVYTITEDAVEGYETQEITGYDITNSHIPETVEVSGSKTWNDGENQDGKRPSSITINLLANGEKVSSKVVTEADDWKWSFTDLDKYQDGKLITYSISEEKVEEYESTVNGYNVTNEHKPGKTSVSGSKTWDDGENQDGKRPVSITINLHANGEKVSSKEVTAADGWEWNFTDLDEYKDGEEIVYTITEDAVEGYETQVSGSNVKNTHKPETISVSGSKTWDDGENQDGKRPSSITINLLANGEKVSSKVVTEADGWKWNFTNLPKYAEGTEIVYTITEDAVEGYETEISGSNVKNTHIPEKISVSGSKTWNDGENQDGKRPSSITINLLANGEKIASKEVTSADDWKWSFTDLDKYQDGKLITYSISEEKVEEYESTVNGYNVTNEHKPGKTSVSGSKTWDDEENQDGKRPSSITINLHANGEKVSSKEVTAADGWEWNFTDLDEYKDGEEIVYTITEDAVEGYETQVSGSNVKNTHKPETISVSGSKTWDDGENQDGKRPSSITINLLANGEKVSSKVVTEADGWKWNFTNLPKYAEGTEIVYTITEDAVEGYETEISGSNVKNTHIPEKISVSGSKTWNDGENQDGKRPSSITINLLANGEKIASKEVTSADDWKWSFTDLDKYQDGKLITYSISEEKVEEYESTVNGYNVTNEHKPGKTSVSGSKTWDDGENQDGKRPSSITINLHANGEKIASKEVTAADGWEWNFTDLDEYKDGEEIVYTITEDAVEGYQTEISGSNVKNTHIPETTSVSGSKTWNDEENQDGKRPVSITINLLANGEKVSSKTVTERDNWTFQFDNLDKYADGKEIVYTITEDAVEFYTTQINGTRVFNTHKTEKTKVEGSKTWQADENGQEAIPESITIRLFAGTEEVASKIVTAEDGWKWSFENLDKFKDGQEIVYTITEDRVNDYSTEYSGYDVLNTYTPDYTQISVQKVWDDNDNQDGIRPESIMVQLYEGLFKKGDAVELNEGNNWSYTWSKLPDSRFGFKINYSVKEISKVDGYEAEVVDGTMTTITNVHIPETVEVSGSKTWDDNDNQDGIRPMSIVVNLLADGDVIDSVVVTEEDEWKWSFTDLPKNKNVNGVISEIVYRVTEDLVIGYEEAVITGYDIRNPHTPEVITIEGSKIWDDAGDQDGKRPAGITVHLFANGTEVDSKTVSEADGWSWKFENLDKYKGGVEIVYTLTEDAVDGYSTVVDGFNVMNRYTPGVTSRTVNKVWDDAGNRDNLRPASIRVQLYADDEAYGDEVILSEANGWSYTWSDLAEKRDGKWITYRVAETVTVEGYTTSYSDDTFVITNVHIPGDEPTPTPGGESTPTPGREEEPTPTPGENPTPGTQITPSPGDGSTPTPEDEEVLGARRGRGAVLGARRAPRTAVLGKRRRPATGDTLALFIWIMVLSLSAGGAVVSSTMLKYKKKDEE